MEEDAAPATEDPQEVIMKDHVGQTDDDVESSQEFRTLVPIREKIRRVMDSHKFQVCTIALVILDCLLVISELLFDLEILVLHEDNFDVPDILHTISIAILSVFVVEILVKIYAYRLDFFRDKFEIFDALVVFVSFGLDIAYWRTHAATNGIGLLIMLRLWRVTRILNGIVMSVKKEAEHHLVKERQLRQSLEQEVMKLQNQCWEQEVEIERLKALLNDNRFEQL